MGTTTAVPLQSGGITRDKSAVRSSIFLPDPARIFYFINGYCNVHYTVYLLYLYCDSTKVQYNTGHDVYVCVNNGENKEKAYFPKYNLYW